MNDIIHHPPYGQPNVRYKCANIRATDCVRYCRRLLVRNACPHPLSGPPYTWVLAEVPNGNYARTIYYVDVRSPSWMWWKLDGQFLPARRARHRDSLIVDPELLDSPLTARTAKRTFTAEQSEYFWTQRAYFRKTWTQILARDREAARKRGFDVELYPVTWKDRVYDWLVGPDWQEVVLRSEQQPKFRIADTNYVFCHWTWHSPERPNIIGPHALGGTKEVIGFLAVDPWAQASRMDRYIQRVFYFDHNYDQNKIDGVDPPQYRDRTTVAIDSIQAGIPFPAYRPERYAKILEPEARSEMIGRARRFYQDNYDPAHLERPR